MGVKSVCRESSDRKKWDKIFKNLVKWLQTKQDAIESLLKDRKSLEDKLKTKHENWISDVRNYEEQLSLMKREVETMQFFETSKSNLLSVLKEKDHSLCNLKLDEAVDELKDFKSWFDFLTLNTSKDNGDSEAAESLEVKISKLKLEYERLASEKKCEVSDLRRENGFALSQFKCIQSGFTDKLKRRDEEIAQANTKISSLLSFQEQLQSSNHENAEIISSLKAEVAEMKASSIKKDEEISKLSRDLESLKKSRSFTPVLTRCTMHNGSSVGSEVTRKKDKSAASPPNDKEIRSSKRKRVTISETPKLFTSTFRLPKLKSPSSGAK
ncbi:BnaC07g14890D [Brassica napus]|uniref:BnaC07g14890D protein n=1 Tax=Brassica napus TaxID=3708 RepID=A0A078HZX5_BRANA|nr:BnaC07g14890D [Brassica napus]